MTTLQQIPASAKRLMQTAKVPVEYEEACRALAKCRTIDEAKLWNDKAEALAVWAKIYKSERAAVEAKRLRLHAYRRMDALAQELRPGGLFRDQGGLKGSMPGPRTLLMEHGLTLSQTVSVRHVGMLSKKTFDRAIESSNPPAPSSFLFRNYSRGSSDSWRLFSQGPGNAASFRSMCRRHSAKRLAEGIHPDESDKCRSMIREIGDWLDEFEQYLPSVSRSA